MGSLRTKKAVGRASRNVTLTKAKTTAKVAFENNMDWVIHMLAFARREMTSLSRDIDRITKAVAKAGRLSMSKQQATRFRAKTALSTQRLAFSLEWIPVIIVTIVETYLQDVRVEAAASDESLMAKSDQKISYDELLSAGSLDNAVLELRRRWARNFVDKGGPTVWIERLKGEGAHGYASTTASALEHLLGTRHVVVHNAGIVTSDFLQHHPNIGAMLGKRVPASLEMLGKWSSAAFDFAENTDSYFVGRFPELDTKSTRGSV